MKISRYLNKSLIPLFFIIAIAIFLRIYALDSLPGSLSADEASLGYTTFSLLNTGGDLHGNIFPLAYSAFGSAWTLIGYPLVDMLPQLILGLNEFSVRLPSAIAGIIGVILIYFIAKTLFKSKRTAILAAFVFAISPWNIYFSRMAYEANLALVFFLGGLLCFINYVSEEKRKDSLLIYSVILFSLTQFIYYSYVIFIPLFFIVLLFLYKSIILNNKKIILVAGISIFFFALSFVTTFKSSIGEVSTLSIFGDKNIIYERVEKFRTDNSGESIFLQRLLHTKYLGVSYQLAQNYINSFTPSFLFDKGGNKIVNDIGYFGKFYLIDALFLFLGATGIFYKREKSLLLLSSWLFISPIASAITNDAPSSTRLYILMPLFCLIIAYGMNQLIDIFNKKMIGKVIICISVGFVILNFIFFIDAYFIHFNYQRVRFLNYGYKQAVELSQKYPDYKVVMRGPENFPYIYFLFYNNYNPKKFISEVKYYPPTNEGFVFAKSFDRFSFSSSIDTKMEYKTIYIDDNFLRFKDKILLPSGQPILSYSINR